VVGGTPIGSWEGAGLGSPVGISGGTFGGGTSGGVLGREGAGDGLGGCGPGGCWVCCMQNLIRHINRAAPRLVP